MKFSFGYILLFFLIFILGFFTFKPNANCRGRSKKSEALYSLIEIYDLEVDHFEKFKRFSTCLNQIESHNMHYIVGFPKHDDYSTTPNLCPKESYFIPKDMRSPNKELLLKVFKSQNSFSSPNTFTAYAVGNLKDAKNEGDLDIWSINEKKKLTHVQVGNVGEIDDELFFYKIKTFLNWQ